MKMMKVAVLVSGGGTNLQALLDAQHAGKLGCARLALVISDREGVPALERAGIYTRQEPARGSFQESRRERGLQTGEYGIRALYPGIWLDITP